MSDDPGDPQTTRPADQSLLALGSRPTVTATLFGPGGAGGPTLPSGPSQGASGPAPAASDRRTILPQVAFDGEVPLLVVEGRRRYETLRPLGRGGLGEVVGAWDHDIGRMVALKKLRPDVQHSPHALMRFVEEIRTNGLLEHPNIVTIHDVGADEQGDYYFVMRFVDGETLAAIIAKLAAGDPEYHRRYTFERRLQLFRGLLEAVAFAHSRGILHRDLKPANVMVGPFGEVQLMDWGIAKGVGTAPEQEPGRTAGPGEPVEREELATSATLAPERLATAHGTIIGTPAYMSPEQARGGVVDERSEVYSLCVLLYELLTLRHYLADLSSVDDVLRGVQQLVPPLAGSVRHPAQPPVPMDLTWFLRRGLAKDPARRFPSVQALVDYLDARAEGLIPIQCHITLLKRISTTWIRFLDRHPLAVTLLLGGLLVSSAAGAVIVGRSLLGG